MAIRAPALWLGEEDSSDAKVTVDWLGEEDSSDDEWIMVSEADDGVETIEEDPLAIDVLTRLLANDGATADRDHEGAKEDSQTVSVYRCTTCDNEIDGTLPYGKHFCSHQCRKESLNVYVTVQE